MSKSLLRGTVAAVAAGAAATGLALGTGTTAAVAGTAGTTWTATATQAVGPHLGKAIDLGSLAAGTRVQVALGLALRDQAALAAFIHQVSVATEHNPVYGHWLTPGQFTAAYGPTTAQVAKVTDYLTDRGFTHVQVSSNRLYVTADGTAAQVEGAFDTHLQRYRWFGQTVYANTQAAKVPARLGGIVLSVLGLNNVVFASDRPVLAKHAAVRPAVGGCQLNPGTGEPYGLCDYTPKEFWAAYDAVGAPTGSKTTIAIMAEGDLTGVVKDLRLAESKFGLPQVPYTIVPVGVHSPDTSGADEWDLDTQYSTGMAGDVKHLYIYDTTSLTDSDIGLEFNSWVSQDVARAGSASFGECEYFPYLDGTMVTNDEAMNEAAAQGQTMHSSTGDTGGQSCAVAPTNGAPESGLADVAYPASSPYIIAVGGTSLFTNPNGSYETELGWVAGGGGTSEYEYAPWWQDCVVPTAALGEVGYGRSVPDVAMDADENTGAVVYVNGQPEVVGGTSLASPLALGVWARLESAHQNYIGYAGPDLYKMYQHYFTPTSCEENEPVPSDPATPLTTPPYPMHDVYLGSNVAYQNTPGYDYVTGLGSYDVAATVKMICPDPDHDCEAPPDRD